LDLTAQLARFYHWSPDDVEALTMPRLKEWIEAANKMLDAEARARERAQRRR
jgi:hypothetical protein